MRGGVMPSPVWCGTKGYLQMPDTSRLCFPTWYEFGNELYEAVLYRVHNDRKAR